MTVWLVQGWWYRDEASKVIGIFETKRAAEAEVAKREAKQQIWSYIIQRVKVRK